MNKEALKARAAALQTELNALNAELAKPELPEGFIPFEPTEHDAPPCHPQDEVVIITRRGGTYPVAREAKKFRWNKESGYGSSWNIIGYKIVKKYVVQRPMKFSEIPYGTLFYYGSNGTTVFIKNYLGGATTITGNYAGQHTSDSGFCAAWPFYLVDASFNKSKELTVKNP